MNGLTIKAGNLIPTPFAKVSLPVFVVGGFAIGALSGMYFFGDSQLRRL